jgi:hypothetical protein
MIQGTLALIEVALFILISEFLVCCRQPFRYARPNGQRGVRYGLTVTPALR